MYSLLEITDAMKAYNQSVAPGSECNAWGDYVNDCWEQLACGPGGMGAPTEHGRETEYLDEGVYPPSGFQQYWMEVANGNSEDYDPETGDLLE